MKKLIFTSVLSMPLIASAAIPTAVSDAFATATTDTAVVGGLAMVLYVGARIWGYFKLAA